ncbi:TPA: anti-phage dCTP deaminase [Vibrio parahaemolyticus]
MSDHKETNETAVEIVIGLVSPVGVNLEDFQRTLESILLQYGYTANTVHLSQVASSILSDSRADSSPCHSEFDRITTGMEIGNKLRHQADRGDALAIAAIDSIYSKRNNNAPLDGIAHIIRSLKHPDEVETLREVYGKGFYLVGVTSSYSSRREFLGTVKGLSDEQVEILIKRDDAERDKLGQKTRDVFQQADAFISMDSDTKESDIRRITDLIFGCPHIHPTKDEFAMFMANASALRSADLSRQVGAVILNSEGDLIATGANDVPKAGGGLYWPDERDERDYAWGYDSNEKIKYELILEIVKSIRPHIEGITIPVAELTDQQRESLISHGKQLLRDTGLLDITEYGRAVHAEMEAMLSCARNGSPTLGCTLYTTTYPCHNCAKHIVASGVKEVVYIEPYPKSFARILHKDSIFIEGETEEGEKKVIFSAFVGVGPRRFMDLFSMKLGSGRKLRRKVDGKVIDWKRSNASVRVPMLPMSYIDKEAALLASLKS